MEETYNMRGCLLALCYFVFIWAISSLVVGLLVYAGWNVIAVWLFSAPVITFIKAWVAGIILSFFIALVKGK